MFNDTLSFGGGAPMNDAPPLTDSVADMRVLDQAAGDAPASASLPNLMTLYLREVRRFGRLSPDAELQLWDGIAEGNDDAREALICHHLGLVIAMARTFANRGLDLLDLIEEGNLGMLVALQKFEKERGVRFSTYAAWWIRYFLQTALATQVPIVRPPLRQQQHAQRQAWQQWCDSHTATGSAEPTAPAAGARLVTALPLHDDDIEAHFDEAGLHHRDVCDELAEQRDAPRLAALLRTLVDRLPARERDIIVARFGLDGGDECTLAELGEQRGLTRERIRQMQAGALAMLRESLEGLGITRDVALQ